MSEIQNLRARESRSMVGTRHAVSDNKSISGLGMPSPYIPERKQILKPIYRPFITHLLATIWLLCNGFRTFLHGFRIKTTLFCLLRSEGFVGSVIEKYTDFSYFSLRFVNIFLNILRLRLHHLGRRLVCRGGGTGQ